jgi:hypothetical protein
VNQRGYVDLMLLIFTLGTVLGTVLLVILMPLP